MRNALLNIFLLYLIFCFTSGSPLKAQTLSGDLEARFTKAEDIQLFVDSLERNKIALLYTNADTIIRLYHNLINYSISNNFIIEEKKVKILLVESLLRKDFNKYSEDALIMIYEGIEYAILIQNSELLSKNYYLLGLLYGLKKDYKSSLKYHKKAYDEALKAQNYELIIKSIHYVSIVLDRSGLYEEAIFFFKKMDNLRKIIPVQNSIDVFVSNIKRADIYRNLGYLDSALFYRDIASNDLARFSYAPDIITANTHLGDYSLQSKEYKKAKLFYINAYNLCVQKNMNFKTGNILTRIAYVYELLGDYDMQLEYNHQALQSRMIHSSPTFVGSSYANIANSFLNTGQTDSALIFLKKAYGIHKKSGMIDRYLPNDCDKLYQIYRDIGQSDSALKYYIEYKNSSDSLQELNNKQTLQAITYEWKFKEKRLKFEQEEKDNRAEALVLYILLILVLLILIIVFLVIVQLKQKSRQQQMVMRDKVMRLQLNSHFLFNSLIAIQGYVYQNKAELAGEYLSSYAKLMRLFLNNSRSDSISIDVEIETLTNYLQLQTIRFRDKFEFNIHIDPQIDKDNILIPSGLAQPFIENAIEHGLQEKLSRGTIDVRFFINGSSLHIEIEDDGIGVHHSKKSSKKQKHLSLSTLITRERIENLSRRGKAKIHFTINEVNPEADEPGTIVTFILPVQYKSDASKK